MTQLTDADTIHKLFDAYNQATGFGVPFNMAWERCLFDCAQMGLTPEMIVLVVRDRRKGIERGERKPACLMPRNLFYGEDIVNEVIVEAHALMALRRKTVDLGKASVLRATHRPEDHGEPQREPVMAKNALDKALGELRQAINQ